MRTTLTSQSLEPRNIFNHIQDRKAKLSPTKQIGYFRTTEGEAPSGKTDKFVSLPLAIKYLFNSSQDRSISLNKSCEASWIIGEYLNKNPEQVVIDLVKEVDALKTAGNIDSATRTVIALLATMEKNKLKTVLMNILHKHTAYCNYYVIKFAFNQLGEEVVPDLVKNLQTSDSGLKGQIMKILGSLGKDATEAVEALTDIAKNDRSQIGKLAAQTVTEIIKDLTKESDAV